MRKIYYVLTALLAMACLANAQVRKEMRKTDAQQLGKPVAKPATAITSKGFTANWEPVTGAEGYAVCVYEKQEITSSGDYTIIDEDFAGITQGSLIEPLGGDEEYVNLDDYGYAFSAGWSAYGFPNFVPSMVAGLVYSPYINLEHNGGKYKVIITTYSNDKDIIRVESHGSGEKQRVEYEVSIPGGGAGIYEKELEFENGCEDLFFTVINNTAEVGQADYLDRVQVIQHLEAGDTFYSLVAIDEGIDAETSAGNTVTSKTFDDATKYASNGVKQLYYTIQAGAYNFGYDENGQMTYNYVQSPKSDRVMVDLENKTSEVETAIDDTPGRLSLGNYADLEEYGDEPENLYPDGSYWEMAPMNFYVSNSGSQTVLPKADIAQMAGKNITALNLRMFNMADYNDYTREVTIYIGETNKEGFSKNSGKYRYFDHNGQQPVFSGTLSVEETYNWYGMMGPEYTLTFDRPFYYSGKNNLVVTVIAKGDNCSDGGFYINFPRVEGTSSSTINFEETIDPMETLGGSLLSSGSGVSSIDMPAVAYDYVGAAAPDSTWTAFTARYDTDLNIAGLDAFKVTSATNGNITYDKVTEAPAGTSLVIRSLVSPALYSTAQAAETITDNIILKSDGTAENNDNTYIFCEKDGTWGFYHDSSVTIIPEGTLYVTAENSVEPGEEPGDDPQPEDDSVLTLGNFNGNQNDAVAYDGFNNYNSPLTFNYRNSGTQTIYPAAWLTKLDGKAITSMTFSGISSAYTESAYQSTVKAYITEIDDETFPYNGESEHYEWIQTEYAEPQTTLEMTADFQEAYYNGEDFHLVLNFEDKPFVYNGKSLLVTITNESDNYFDFSTDLFQFYFVSRTAGEPYRTAIFASDSDTFLANYGKDHAIKSTDNEMRLAEAPAVQFTLINADDVPTGITEHNAALHQSRNACYNLQGQRVSPNTKGFVIQNGKKRINK